MNLLEDKKDSTIQADPMDNQGWDVQRTTAFGDYDPYGRNYYEGCNDDCKSRQGDYRDRDQYYRGRDEEYRGRDGSFKGRGRGFIDSQEKYERGYQDGLTRRREENEILEVRQKVYLKLDQGQNTYQTMKMLNV